MTRTQTRAAPRYRAAVCTAICRKPQRKVNKTGCNHSYYNNLLSGPSSHWRLVDDGDHDNCDSGFHGP